MKKYEYAMLTERLTHGCYTFFLEVDKESEKVNEDYHYLSFLEVLNILGKDGWMLVSTLGEERWMLMREMEECE